MLYHLFKYLDEVYDLPGSGMFQYISFRAAAAVILSLLIVIIFVMVMMMVLMLMLMVCLFLCMMCLSKSLHLQVILSFHDLKDLFSG